MNLRSQFAVKRPVKLLISAEVDAPISFGWWRPCILLPAGVSLNQLELILNHELAHLRRRDWLVNLLVQVIGAPFFFHPLFYLVRGRLAEVREHICDDWVIQVTGRRADYAQCLVDMLSERGIDEGRTSFAGYGHVRPIADENVRDAAIKNEAMRRNRRVEILIIHPTEIPQSPVMSQRTYDFLRGQLAKALEDLQRTEKALQEAKKSGLFEALRNEDIDLVNQIADTKATLIETRMKFRDKEEQIRQLRTGEGSPPAEVLKLKTQVETLEKQLVQERKMFSDSWPSVVKLQKELVSARQQLVQAEEQAARTSKAQVASKLKQLENELTQLKLEETTLTRQLTRYEQTLTQFPPNVSSLSHLISQKKHAEMVYSFLLQRLNEARILAEIEKADDLIYNFDSIAVNTNDVDAARILIIKIHAVFEKEGVKTQLENLESLRVQLRNKLIAILSSRTAADLLKPQVKDELKESLRGEMNQLLGRGSVAAVYFSEYLIQ